MHLFRDLFPAVYMLISQISSVVAAPLSSDVAIQAGGGLPNNGFPTLISQDAIKEFQLTLFLENLEAFFFKSGLTNFTSWNTSGYSNDTVEVISRIAAQEEVHVTTLTTLLQAYDQTVIPPCNYTFPITSTDQFLVYSDIITSIGIGAIIGLADRISSSDPLLIKSTSSIVTVESRHDAFFRQMDGEVPNPSPFDTGITRVWAYNLALPFVVPGSCPIEIPLPVLPTLSTTNNNSRNDTLRQVEFMWNPSELPLEEEGSKQLFIGWLNQLNLPTYTNLTIQGQGKGTAAVPQGLNGAAFAALTSQKPNNANDFALATLAGPVALKLS